MKKKNKNVNEIEVALLPIPNIIVLPKTSVSFYLQDERYIQMMKDVVQENGMVVLSMTDPVKDPSGQIVPQALLPRAISVLVVPSLMEEHDGLHYGGVIMRGVCKVKITKIVRTNPTLVCRAVPLEDDLSFFDSYTHPEYLHIRGMLQEWIEKNVEGDILRKELLGGLHSPENVINHLSLLMVECRENRQLLLETLSLHDRFEILGIILRQGKWGKSMGGVGVTAQTLRDFFSRNMPNLLPTH